MSAPSVSQDGRIALVDSFTDSDIWKLPIEANQATVRGNPVRLISGLSYEAYPSITRDGLKLSFTSDRSGNKDVWLHDLQSGEYAPITVGEAIEQRGEISKDGTRVAFARSKSENGPKNIYVRDLIAEQEELIVEGVGFHMGWMPSDEELLYYTPPPLRWRTVDVKTRRHTDLEISHPEIQMISPRFSSDTNWVAFRWRSQSGSDRGTVFIAPVQRGKTVLFDQSIQLSEGSHPWWSPDSTTLYFLSGHDGFRCIAFQALDPSTKQPSGPPGMLRHFHGRQRIIEGGDSQFGYAMNADWLYLPLSEAKANIWLAEAQTTK